MNRPPVLTAALEVADELREASDAAVRYGLREWSDEALVRLRNAIERELRSPLRRCKDAA